MPLFRDAALVRHERRLAEPFRNAGPTQAEGLRGDGEPLRVYVMLDRARLPLVRCAGLAADAVRELIWEQRRNEDIGLWANRHKTIVLVEAGGQDQADMAAYFSKLGKPSAAITSPSLGDAVVASAFAPIPTHDGKVLFGRFRELSLEPAAT